MIDKLLVKKASGVTEPFSIQKLRGSLKRANASSAEIDAIVADLLPKLYQNISTKKIYSEAFRLLRSRSNSSAAKYNLKQGIMQLGPSGFPFEKFIGKILEHQGYSVLVGQILKGTCVNHEIDVIARKKEEVVLIECKYHNRQGIAVDVKIPLYINSRFEDVLDNKDFKHSVGQVKGWIATNSKFTSDAIAYGKCKEMHLLSWDYPQKNALRDLIDNSGLYPLTCLTTLTKQEKNWLLAHDLVLVKQIYQNNNLLLKAGVSNKRLIKVFEEGKQLCFGKGQSESS